MRAMQLLTKLSYPLASNVAHNNPVIAMKGRRRRRALCAMASARALILETVSEINSRGVRNKFPVLHYDKTAQNGGP